MGRWGPLGAQQPFFPSWGVFKRITPGLEESLYHLERALGCTRKSMWCVFKRAPPPHTHHPHHPPFLTSSRPADEEPTVFLLPLIQPLSPPIPGAPLTHDWKMAQEFVQTKIKGDKVVLFIKPTCSYCIMAKDVLSKYKFRG